MSETETPAQPARRSTLAGTALAVTSAAVPSIVLSLVPDAVVGVTGSLPGTTWLAVGSLMVIYVIVTVCGVAAYNHFLPLPARR